MQATTDRDKWAEGASPAPSTLFEEHAAILMDPASGSDVQVQDGDFVVLGSGRRIDVVDGIPNFFVPADFNTERQNECGF